MAARPTWKGHLKLSLVTIGVRVFCATDGASKIRFNQLHSTCGTRIKQRRWCPACKADVPKEETVKGYEHAKGCYVTIDESEIDQAKPDSSRIIGIERVVDQTALDPITFERPYFLAPDGDAATSGFTVIRDALAGKAAIGKVAISGREYAVAILPRGRGLLLFTLREPGEVRSLDDVAELGNVPESAPAGEIELARQLVSTLPNTLDPEGFVDAYQNRLRAMIDAKIAGDEYSPPETAAPADSGGLMAALQRSLEASRNADAA